MHPVVFIQTVFFCSCILQFLFRLCFFQKCKVLFLYRPCAQSSSIEYVNKIFSGGFTHSGKKYLIGRHLCVQNTSHGSLIKDKLNFHLNSSITFPYYFKAIKSLSHQWRVGVFCIQTWSFIKCIASQITNRDRSLRPSSC